MRRRDTMLLRNSRALLPCFVFFLSVVAAIGQNSTQPDAFPSGVPAPPPPAAKPQAAPEGQPAAKTQAESSSIQEESGGFLFHKEVDEVVLHATVVDDKQRMITNLERGAFTVYED